MFHRQSAVPLCCAVLCYANDRPIPVQLAATSKCCHLVNVNDAAGRPNCLRGRVSDRRTVMSFVGRIRIGLTIQCHRHVKSHNTLRRSDFSD